LIDDWNFDLDQLYWRPTLSGAEANQEPQGWAQDSVLDAAWDTANKLLAAVRGLAQQEFADRRRYAFALHTDERHPHVHMVQKAMTEDWKHRLNIRKPMLRKWRKEFARHLRAQGVPAKATRRKSLRKTATKLTGIYRLVKR